MSWLRRFDEPIALPGGLVLTTLRDAADHIQKLPRSHAELPHWQMAIEHLIYAAERPPAWMTFARMAFMLALHHGAPTAPAGPRKKAVKTYRIVR